MMFLVAAVVVVDQHQEILQEFQEHLLLFDNLLDKTKDKILIKTKEKKIFFSLHDKEQQDI